MYFIEKLVQHPSLYVQTWRIREDMTIVQIRDALLGIRQLEITNLILFTNRPLSQLVLEEVSVTCPERSLACLCCGSHSLDLNLVTGLQYVAERDLFIFC